MCAPTLAALPAALPPEGDQFAPWDGPAARMCTPTLAALAAALPPEGDQLAPWDGPAARMRARMEPQAWGHANDRCCRVGAGFSRPCADRPCGGRCRAAGLQVDLQPDVAPCSTRHRRHAPQRSPRC